VSNVSTVLLPVSIHSARPALPALHDFKVRVGADCDPTHAVGRSLERRTGLVLINLKPEGANQEDGRVVSRDYEASLGVRSSGNTYRIDRVIRFTIPAR
jgi:hypothetical protein